LLKALNLLDASKDDLRREFTVGFKDLFSLCGANGASGTACAPFFAIPLSVAASRVGSPLIRPISRDSADFRCSKGSFERAPRRYIQVTVVETVGHGHRAWYTAVLRSRLQRWNRGK
jgi:hypothetical protein